MRHTSPSKNGRKLQMPEANTFCKKLFASRVRNTILKVRGLKNLKPQNLTVEVLYDPDACLGVQIHGAASNPEVDGRIFSTASEKESDLGKFHGNVRATSILCPCVI
jgi:hypothetical protein